VGIFLTSSIPSARVIADARERTVAVEFRALPSPSLVILIPEDSVVGARVVEATPMDVRTQVRFADVPHGRYLLSVYVQVEEL